MNDRNDRNDSAERTEDGAIDIKKITVTKLPLIKTHIKAGGCKDRFGNSNAASM